MQAGRSIESIFAELASQGLARTCPATAVTDYLGGPDLGSAAPPAGGEGEAKKGECQTLSNSGFAISLQRADALLAGGAVESGPALGANQPPALHAGAKKGGAAKPAAAKPAGASPAKAGAKGGAKGGAAAAADRAGPEPKPVPAPSMAAVRRAVVGSCVLPLGLRSLGARWVEG